MTNIPATRTLTEAIFTRRSIRRYTSQPVAREQLEAILEAAVYAPSAHNRQPWRFAVAQSAQAKETLAQAMGARLRADLQADHVPEDIITKDTQRSYERLTSAPVLIVVCLTMTDMDIYRDARRNDNEKVMAVQSVAMAGQNILLAAHAHGLGACWMCAPLFCPDVVQAALQLPDDWQAQGIITMGYPAQTRESTREPLETRLMWR
jgi:coenzyme F420-0:L-glutamate ligase/coenzyme F420-1:gamma-L-glutamate ligase